MPKIQSKSWTRTDGKVQHVLVIGYEAELVNGTPKVLDEKVSEVGWFTIEETESLDLLQGIKEFLDLFQ